MGAAQLVVHEALETMSWVAGSYSSWLMPMTSVASTPVPGEVSTTFRAPAARWAAAFSRVRNRPVASITTSTPTEAQSSAAGSGCCVMRTDRPPTVMTCPSRWACWSHRP